MVSPTLSSSSQQTWSNNNLWLCILFAFAMITQYWGLLVPAHTTAMSYPYTTSPSDIFAPFHLKCAIRLAISLIARGYSFIATNLGKCNLIKLTNNQTTQENWSILNVVQFAEFQDSLSFSIIFSCGPKSNLQSSMLLLLPTPMPAQYQARSRYELIFMPCDYRNQ